MFLTSLIKLHKNIKKDFLEHIQPLLNF